MKILFGSYGFGFKDNHGGSALVSGNNAIELAKRGHDVTFFCTNTIDKTKKYYATTTKKIIKGVKVFYLDTYTIPFWPGSFGPNYVLDLEKHLEKEGPFDIIHLNEYRSHISTVLARWAIRKKIPFTIQPQGTLIKGKKNILIKNIFDFLFKKTLLLDASCVIPVTNAEKELAKKFGVQEGRLEVIPTGIDISEFSNVKKKGEFRNKFGIPPDKKMILFVGRLDWIKGIDILIEAYSKMDRAQEILVIVGPNHGFKNKIEAIINKFNLEDDVIITGPLPDYADVLSAINDSDVMAIPSRAEAFGMVILEGGTLKKPMVISKNCNVSDEFEKSALVVSPEPEKVAEAIKLLLSDMELSFRLGNLARNKVLEKFQIGHVAERFERLFQTLLDNK